MKIHATQICIDKKKRHFMVKPHSIKMVEVCCGEMSYNIFDRNEAKITVEPLDEAVFDKVAKATMVSEVLVKMPFMKTGNRSIKFCPFCGEAVEVEYTFERD